MTTDLDLHRGGGVLDLFRDAIAKGAEGAGAMETLYKLHVAEREHNARLSFNLALAAFQAGCPAIPRSSKAEIVTRTGTKFGYKYADLEQIAETIGPHLRDAGLSYSFDSTVSEANLTCTVTLRHIDGHSERASFTLPTASASAMSEQQKVGAALTFAKRQCLTAILGLALTDPDPDASADPTPVSDEQAANIQALIDETKADMARFLAYMGAESIAEIRAADYARAVAALEHVRARGAKK